MDSLITAAARALAAGDPLGALQRVALREDAPALALRGIAMAQLGDFVRARELLRGAARAYAPRETLARARCVVAEAEIALAARDLHWPAQVLEAACATLERHGDVANAALARYLAIRRLLLVGRLHEAAQRLAALDPASVPAALGAVHELIAAGIALRRVQAAMAGSALARAAAAARRARIPALMAEVEAASGLLLAPAARLILGGTERDLRLGEVEALLSSQRLIVDGCRLCIRARGVVIELATRPVLFALVRLLAEAWPADVPRVVLAARAFCARRMDDSHRARLRVEIGRLRKLLRPLAGVVATAEGFLLKPRGSVEVAVLAPPVEEPHAAVLALLADGESWPSSALSLALGTGPRSVQRALKALADKGRVQAVGRGRARRWMTPVLPAIATTLLLPVPLAGE